MASVKVELERLKPSLTALIQKWIEDATEESNELGWIGENLAVCMSDAAMAVLAASEDVQNYLRKEDHIRD